jgi:hypothetical protein
MTAKGSPKTVIASSKLTLCLFRLEVAFLLFHSKRTPINVATEQAKKYQFIVKDTVNGSKIKYFTHFTAQGKGTAFLRGRGHYETRHSTGDWTTDGLTVETTKE